MLNHSRGCDYFMGFNLLGFEMDFLIIVTGFNCHQYVKSCVDSIKNQTYKNFTAVLISDGSSDRTEAELRFNTQLPIHRNLFKVEIFNENTGAAKRRFDAIHKYSKDDETIIILVGMDDELKPHCLQRIKEEYEKGVWVTYGNWMNQHREMLPDGFLEFDDDTHNNRNYRRVKYRSTAPNSFKKFLFDRIPEGDFKINGRWIDSTTESEVMFSCLEMSGRERIGIIHEPIYLYNANLSNGTIRRLGHGYKYKILEQIMSREKKPLLTR